MHVICISFLITGLILMLTLDILQFARGVQDMGRAL